MKNLILFLKYIFYGFNKTVDIKPTKKTFQSEMEKKIKDLNKRETPKGPSKFQQRLDEMAAAHNINKDIISGDNANDNLNLHKEWIDIQKEKPVWYAPVDIHTGKKIYENYARVSDGEMDYYVNSKDNHVVLKVTHWRKREGIVYPKYDPITEEDLKPILTPYDVGMIMNTISRMLGEISKEYNQGLTDSITVIEESLNRKLGNVK